MTSPFRAAQTLQAVNDNNLPHLLRNLAIRDAYDRLHADDREMIDHEADDLAAHIKQHLGRSGAIEVLAKIGMLLVTTGNQEDA